MPGLPLVARETATSACNCGYSGSADHMCRQDQQHPQLSEEEKIAAEESLAAYCKPVELYNILQRRAVQNPSFLQRCLQYTIQAKHKKRIQMTVSLPSSVNDESQVQRLFPLSIFLARPIYSPAVVEDAAVYHFSRVCILTKCSGDNRKNQDAATFILPEISKLASEVKSGSISVLFVSCADMLKEPLDCSSFPGNVEGHCLMGKVPMELLQFSWEKSLNLSSGETAELLSTVGLNTYFLKTGCIEEDKCISFYNPHAGSMAVSQQLQVRIAAEEVGARERSPYDSFPYCELPSSTLPQIIRLRTGNVIFNYEYYDNKLQRTEVTEDFTCPFCLVQCSSFKGLRYHLLACHDLFNFEFWVTEEFQAVNVSVKTDMWKPEIVAAGVDPRQQTFSFCSKTARCRKRRRTIQRSKHVHPLVYDSEMPGSIVEIREKTDGITESVDRDASSPRISSAAAHSFAAADCVQSLRGSSVVPLGQFAKTRKLSERSGSRKRSLLQKRQFFHSQRAQPMAVEQVLADFDSEDEADDDVADLEDRRMLDDFLDVTKGEKRLMHLWNSFVRRQRVLADGHLPWACEAFTKLHRQHLLQTSTLLWCWKLFMVKLWNHGLLDSRVIGKCSVILEQKDQNYYAEDDS